MEIRLRKLVRQRAGDQCEYCRLPQDAVVLTFHVEHIVARQHEGPTDEANLALACNLCNAHKGPNLTAIDPDSGVLVPLFHPRTDAWSEHFQIRNGQVIGPSPVGRATVRLLNMNEPHRVELRAASA